MAGGGEETNNEKGKKMHWKDGEIEIASNSD